MFLPPPALATVGRGDQVSPTGGGLDVPPTCISSSFSSSSRPSLSTAKLLDTVTFETIENENEESEKTNLLSAAASETVDSGIGNDEITSESISSKFLFSRFSDIRDGHIDDVDDTAIRSRFSFSKSPEKPKDEENSWRTEREREGGKVTLVTTRFAMLSVSSPEKETPEKVIGDAISPPGITHMPGGIFNIKLLRENALRESEGSEPLQPSPNLEDSSSTCSYLTISGSSGFFSKSSTTEGSASTKASPTTEGELTSEINSDHSIKPFSFLRSSLSTTKEHIEAQTDTRTVIKEEPSEIKSSFSRTRFSFLTKDYLPASDASSEESVIKSFGLSTVTSPVSTSFQGLDSTSGRFSTDVTPAVSSPLVTSSEASSPPKTKSRYFSFLNIGNNEKSSEEPEKKKGLTDTKAIKQDENLNIKKKGKKICCHNHNGQAITNTLI